MLLLVFLYLEVSLGFIGTKELLPLDTRLVDKILFIPSWLLFKFSTWILKAETFSLTDVKVCVMSLVTSLDKLLKDEDILLNEVFMLSFKLLSSCVLSLGSSLFLCKVINR